MNKPRIYHVTYVYEPSIEDYLRMGWMYGQLHYHANGYWCWIMIWPCACKAPYLRKF